MIFKRSTCVWFLVQEDWVMMIRDLIVSIVTSLLVRIMSLVKVWRTFTLLLGTLCINLKLVVGIWLDRIYCKDNFSFSFFSSKLGILKASQGKVTHMYVNSIESLLSVNIQSNLLLLCDLFRNFSQEQENFPTLLFRNIFSTRFTKCYPIIGTIKL